MLQGISVSKNEAHLIEQSAFLPQKNACLIEHKRDTRVKATSENIMDSTNSHKTKGLDCDLLHWYNAFHG
jgi:hypothetical protein